MTAKIQYLIVPEKTCCFTGHRKLEMSERELEKRTLELIQKAVAKGYRHFVCGGALGFDMLAAEQIVFMREIWKGEITLEIAIPCIDQTKMWSRKQRMRYEALLEVADIKTYVSDKEYTSLCMQVRNQYMVRKSSLCIAYYTGKSGGTRRTIEYAERHGCEVWLVK